MRASLTASFGPLTAQTVFNSPGDDRDPWLSPDQRYFVMTSDRGGDYELYESRR